MSSGKSKVPLPARSPGHSQFVRAGTRSGNLSGKAGRASKLEVVLTGTFFTIVDFCLTIVRLGFAKLSSQDAEFLTPSLRYGWIGDFNDGFAHIGVLSLTK